MFLIILIFLQDGFYDWCALGAAIGSKNGKMAKFLVQEMKAKSSLVNQRSRNLLVEAIFKSDFWAVKLLCQELHSEINVFVMGPGFKFYPLHYAMWIDVQNSRSDWKMTKLVLTQGANPSLVSSWTKIKDSILMESGEESGDAIQFAKTLKEVGSAKIKTHCFDQLLELMTEQEDIEALIKAIDKDNEGCHKFLAKLNPNKTFLRSPLVFATSKGRQDLVQMMINCFGFDVNEKEEASGMNPLSTALSLSNWEMANYLVEEVGANVNEQTQLSVDCPDLGTSITVAVQNDDFDSTKLLWDNGAIVSDAVFISEELKMTTNLHLAMKRMAESKNESVFKLLISLGADITTKGWIDIDSRYKYVSPMELALMYKIRKTEDTAFWIKVVDKLDQMFMKLHIDELKEMSVSESVVNLNEEVLFFKLHQKRLQQKLEIWKTLPDRIQGNVVKIQELKSKPAYMSPEDIKNAELVFLNKMVSAKSLNEKIAQIQRDPNYLHESELTGVRKLVGKLTQSPGTKCSICRQSLIGLYRNPCASAFRKCQNCTRTQGQNCCYQIDDFHNPSSFWNQANSLRVDTFLSKSVNLAQEVDSAQKKLDQVKELKATKGFMCPEELEMFIVKHETKLEEAKVLEALIQAFPGRKLFQQYQLQMEYLENLLAAPKETVVVLETQVFSVEDGNDWGY